MLSTSIDTTYNRFKQFTRAEGGVNRKNIDKDAEDLQSGADSGFGAKAQQILEQVRGRDF